MTSINSQFVTPAEQLTAFFNPSQPRETYGDAEIERVALLLQRCEPAAQSCPRTYIVLRTSGHLDKLASLLDAGFSDGWFPVEPRGLPNFLDPRTKADIVRCQTAIMTKSLDLENGKHCHFGSGEPLPFETLARLGGGGQGEVVKIESKISCRQYALKIIRRRTAFGNQTKEAMREFLTEMRIMRGLEHQHLVRYVGSYTDKHFLGLVMSPIADCDLTIFMQKACTTLDMRPTMKTFFGCLAAALSYLHDNNIKHRDIKPGNILVRNSVVLIADFGLSHDFLDTTSGFTSASPRYCAPEVAAYEKRNTSADVWSLGCVFLELLAALQGQDVPSLKELYANLFSCSTHFFSNPEATEALLQSWEITLKVEDRKPVSWIRSMMVVNRQARPKSAQLLETITESGNSMTYCGLCCGADDMSDSMGSLLDELELVSKAENEASVTPPVQIREPPRERTAIPTPNRPHESALQSLTQEQPRPTTPDPRPNRPQQSLAQRKAQSLAHSITASPSFSHQEKKGNLVTKSSLYPTYMKTNDMLERLKHVPVATTTAKAPEEDATIQESLNQQSHLQPGTRISRALEAFRDEKDHRSDDIKDIFARYRADDVAPTPHRPPTRAGSKSPGKVGRVFGVELMTSIVYAGMNVTTVEWDPYYEPIAVDFQLPIVVAKCISLLVLRGTERSFHIRLIDWKYRTQIETMFETSKDYGRDFHWPAESIMPETDQNAGSILLSYLRSLPSKLISGDQASQLLQHAAKTAEDDDLNRYTVQTIIFTLPKPHLELVLYLFGFFNYMDGRFSNLDHLEYNFAGILIDPIRYPDKVSRVFKYLVEQSRYYLQLRSTNERFRLGSLKTREEYRDL